MNSQQVQAREPGRQWRNPDRVGEGAGERGELESCAWYLGYPREITRAEGRA